MQTFIVVHRFDSNVSTSDSDEDGGSDNKASEKKKEKKKERKEKKKERKEPSESVNNFAVNHFCCRTKTKFSI